MGEEIKFLKENNTSTIATLPIGKNVVGGRYVYATKENVNNTRDYKARYIVKWFGQVKKLNYHET